MKAHPMLFSAPMVRALLDGRKTQTRQPLKPQPRDNWHFHGFNIYNQAIFHPDDCFGLGAECEAEYEHWDGLTKTLPQPGALIWVRETFVLESDREYVGEAPLPADRPIRHVDDGPDWGKYHLIPHYRATEPEPNIVPYDAEEPHTLWSPSIHMPRWSSRLTLRVTNVKVERLQGISTNDCYCEAALERPKDTGLGSDVTRQQIARRHMAELWNTINGPSAWNANPWVVVYTFDVIKANVDDVLRKDAA